jgi:hypothetical protein
MNVVKETEMSAMHTECTSMPIVNHTKCVNHVHQQLLEPDFLPPMLKHSTRSDLKLGVELVDAVLEGELVVNKAREKEPRASQRYRIPCQLGRVALITTPGVHWKFCEPSYRRRSFPHDYCQRRSLWNPSSSTTQRVRVVPIH